jgi:hypothetical protein
MEMKISPFRFSPKTDTDTSIWNIASLVAATIWYIGLFPGRIGYDPIQAVKLMRSDKSTDWWTSLYFRVLELTTFQGKSIWFASLVSLLILYVSFKYFLYSIPVKNEILDKTSFVICISPLFGNFAVNLSHDVFFVSAIMLLLGYSYRRITQNKLAKGVFLPCFIIILLLCSKSGYIIILLFLLYLVVIKVSKTRILFYSGFTLFVFTISNLGVTKSPVPLEILPLVADLKCVVQHPKAEISEAEILYLSKIAKISEWREPATCSSMDKALDVFTNLQLNAIGKKEFLANYLSISSKNPAIVIQSHLQRSSVALPPPFFQGPQNHVDQNINNPVGLNTNTALQLGPEVLHPSIDDPSFKKELGPVKYLESILLLFSFLMNQASWFWPTLLTPLFLFRMSKFNALLKISYPIVGNHIFLFFFSPIPAPRYVMSTILIGFTYTVLLVISWFDKQKSKG